VATVVVAENWFHPGMPASAGGGDSLSKMLLAGGSAVLYPPSWSFTVAEKVHVG